VSGRVDPGNTDSATQMHVRTPRPPAERSIEVAPDGSMSLKGRSLNALVAEHGSPLHVIEADVVAANADAAVSAGAFSTVFSSYKTNPVPAVLEILHAHGIGAEGISPFEWWLALEIGVAADRIIYNGPAKSIESMTEAAEAGVFLVNANSVTDIDRMAEAAEAAGRPMRSGLRISLPHMWGGQFGIDASSSTVIESVEKARRSRWLDLLAIHAHSGFPLAHESDVERHVTTVLDVIDRIADATGWSPSLLDLGGSAGCRTVKAPGEDDVVSLTDVIRQSESIVSDHARRTGRARPELLFEPGKALTADTQFTLTTVLAVDETTGPDTCRTAIVDIGVGLAEPLRSEHHDTYNLTNPDGEPAPTRLIGPDAVGDDALGDPILLPEVRTGDVLAVLDTGAYFVPFARSPSRLRPAIVTLDSEMVRVGEDSAHVHRVDIGLDDGGSGAGRSAE